MNRPPAGRRLAAVLIDLALVVVAAPVLLIAIGVALSWLLYLLLSGDCADPCDGPAMAAFAIATMVVLAMSILYWPVLVYWGRRTVGSRMVGLRFEGCGIRRYFAWDAGTLAEASDAPVARARPDRFSAKLDRNPSPRRIFANETR